MLKSFRLSIHPEILLTAISVFALTACASEGPGPVPAGPNSAAAPSLVKRATSGSKKLALTPSLSSSDAEEKKIAWEGQVCMDSVDQMASRRFPNDAVKQADYINIQNEACITKVMRKHKRPKRDWYKIETRAAKEHWPLPPVTR